MPQVVRATAGEHVPIRVKARERRTDSGDGALFDVMGIRVRRIGKPDGTDIASGSLPSFAFVTTGEYIAQWNTSGLDAGDYEVEIEAITGYDSVAAANITSRRDVTIRLRSEGAP